MVHIDDKNTTLSIAGSEAAWLLQLFVQRCVPITVGRHSPSEGPFEVGMARHVYRIDDKNTNTSVCGTVFDARLNRSASVLGMAGRARWVKIVNLGHQMRLGRCLGV